MSAGKRDHHKQEFFLYNQSTFGLHKPQESIELEGTREEMWLQLAFWFWAHGVDPLDGDAMMKTFGYTGAQNWFQAGWAFDPPENWAKRRLKIIEAIRDRTFEVKEE